MDYSQSLCTSDSGDIIPKQVMKKILSQEIDSFEARYRIQAGGRVYYVLIPGNPRLVFDEETLCRPQLLLSQLPPFPNNSWTTMSLERNSSGNIKSTICAKKLEGIEAWYSRDVEVTTLRPISSYKHRIQEVEFEGQHAIAKIAPFEWWNPMADRETLTYEIITKEHPTNTPLIAPCFLAQLTEQGRVMGFLLEKVEGRPAEPEDIPACEVALRGLHSLGLIHGDVNRYNFIVNVDGSARMIDFEHASLHTQAKGEEELEELRAMFSLDSGLGTTTMLVDGREQQAGPTLYVN